MYDIPTWNSPVVQPEKVMQHTGFASIVGETLSQDYKILLKIGEKATKENMEEIQVPL